MPILSDKKCLIILGMHRSGTSSLTGALHFTGFDIGKSVMPPADENPKGFFENTKITDLNDKILEELFCFWSDTLFIPEGWWKEEKFGYFKTKVKDILHEEFSGNRPLMIKDPRLSMVLPLYLEVFKEEGITPVFLICVRNPYEVASSLGRRNNMPLEKSLLLWMDYQLKAELYSRGYPRLFISYSSFLENPVEVMHSVVPALNLDGKIDKKAEEEIFSFIDPALSHNSGRDDIQRLDLLPELADIFKLQANAHCRDLSADELVKTDRAREGFISMNRFHNGMAGDYQATLTVQYEDGSKSILTAPVKYGSNTLNFNLNHGPSVTGILLRPCNARTGLTLNKIELHMAGGTVISPDRFTANSSAKNAEGLMLFDTDLPKIIIDLTNPEKISQVSIHLFYHVFGIISCRKAFWRPAITGPRQGN